MAFLLEKSLNEAEGLFPDGRTPSRNCTMRVKGASPPLDQNGSEPTGIMMNTGLIVGLGSDLRGSTGFACLVLDLLSREPLELRFNSSTRVTIRGAAAVRSTKRISWS
ncbi:MAG: hypothetical protein ACLFUE_08760 [Desulfobacteraceae bacterium]